MSTIPPKADIAESKWQRPLYAKLRPRAIKLA
jgi:hypothetical protein